MKVQQLTIFVNGVQGTFGSAVVNISETADVITNYLLNLLLILFSVMIKSLLLHLL